MSAAGKCKCPICGGDARWGVMKTGRVSITHGACGVQVFARGDEADELMRDRFISAGERNERNVQEPAQPAHVTYEQESEGFGIWQT
ncbi:hypothetical protein [Paraburkholderia mimosarum]|uniref:hypothetical protein n=1 Tax=Paraburkholderia mimosarum TaxID=312026 RepID=UPI00040BB662|nr:hypothetical protein [Paraburkholderia mimosarum]